ncbi:exonuclease domain-containing protein [Maioricimonas sp. JC845]|uniref:exonuclease domain-containing protein n=1 Tax=Maioricimonas sp. JC845 TaxID=3232138 RepID=UPI0034576426
MTLFSRTAGRQFAVVDVETTGFGHYDRVLEVAIVVLDESLEVIDEYDTLIDPQRDVGPVHVHGITPSMLAGAPTFGEVAAAVAARLNERILVAHNLSFDQRMICREYERLRADVDPGEGVCTLRQTGEKLNCACRTWGIELDHHHRALADARATARLLQRAFDESPYGIPARVAGLRQPLNPRTLRREANSCDEVTPMERLVSRTRYPTSDGALLSYLDALDWVLDDLVITRAEEQHLLELAADLGLGADDVAIAHRRYLDSMVCAAKRDHVITEQEHAAISQVARLLRVVDYAIPDVTETAARPDSIPEGTRVCFTGAAVDECGNPLRRGDLEAMAAQAGLQPVGSVTKRGCDLLVAADPESRSGKAATARKFGIPIMSVGDFLQELGGRS